MQVCVAPYRLDISAQDITRSYTTTQTLSLSFSLLIRTQVIREEQEAFYVGCHITTQPTSTTHHR